MTDINLTRYGFTFRRAPIPRSDYKLPREREGRRRIAPARVVRARRGSPSHMLRRHSGLGLGLGAEGKGRLDDRRPVRLSDARAERRGRVGSSQGDAGDPHEAGGMGDVAFCAVVRSEGASAIAFRWGADRGRTGRAARRMRHGPSLRSRACSRPARCLTRLIRVALAEALHGLAKWSTAET